MGPSTLFRYSLSFSCKHLIPGMKRFQCGVDGAILDLLSLEEGNDDNGFKNPVVYFTCKEGKKAKIPTSTGKKIYDQPDQIGSVAAIHAGFSSNKVPGIEIILMLLIMMVMMLMSMYIRRRCRKSIEQQQQQQPWNARGLLTSPHGPI